MILSKSFSGTYLPLNSFAYVLPSLLQLVLFGLIRAGGLKAAQGGATIVAFSVVGLLITFAIYRSEIKISLVFVFFLSSTQASPIFGLLTLHASSLYGQFAGNRVITNAPHGQPFRHFVDKAIRFIYELLLLVQLLSFMTSQIPYRYILRVLATSFIFFAVRATNQTQSISL